jgi:hypothetical protein
MDVPTWEDRDLPVLSAAVEACEKNGGFAEVHHIKARVDFDERTIRSALTALVWEEPKLFRSHWSGGAGVGVWRVEYPTGEARRRLRLWPSPESLRPEARRSRRAPDRLVAFVPGYEAGRSVQYATSVTRSCVPAFATATTVLLPGRSVTGNSAV